MKKFKLQITLTVLVLLCSSAMILTSCAKSTQMQVVKGDGPAGVTDVPSRMILTEITTGLEGPSTYILKDSKTGVSYILFTTANGASSQVLVEADGVTPYIE